MNKKNPCALITGISGQDGTYLAELLLRKNYKIIGISQISITNITQWTVRYAINNQVFI